jgi:hypothetical protein
MERKAMKLYRLAAGFTVFVFLLGSFAGAQERFDLYLSMGTAQVSGSNYQDIPTPPMGGVFGTIGGGLMLNPNYGFGAQVSLRFAQGGYADLRYRPIFYDFNGIFTPQISKAVVPEFQAGFGGVSLRFYNPPSQNHYSGVGAVGLRFYNSPSPNHDSGVGAVGLRLYIPTSRYLDYPGAYLFSLNHFQLHAAVGLRFKLKSRLKPNIYVRPQLDYHWAPNLKDEFTSNSVLGYSLALVFSGAE